MVAFFPSSAALPTLEDWIVKQPPEILEPGRDTVHERDAGERPRAARLEDHPRGGLQVLSGRVA